MSLVNVTTFVPREHVTQHGVGHRVTCIMGHRKQRNWRTQDTQWCYCVCTALWSFTYNEVFSLWLWL